MSGPDIVCVADPLGSEADALLVTAYPDALSPLAQEVDAALGGVLTEMRASHELRGKFAEITVVPTLGKLKARRVIILGLGDPAKLDSYRVTNAFHFAGDVLRKRRLSNPVVAVDPIVITALGDELIALRAIVTGVLLGNVEAVHVDESGPVPRITGIKVSGVAADAPVTAALREAAVLADVSNRVRLWAKLPGNQLTPTQIGERTVDLFADTAVTVDVLDKAALTKAGAGALLSVGQGSAEPPVMITMRYQGGDAAAPTLALVGKGITFDTGGISIKPALGMELMKFDMSGAAAVINAVCGIAELQLRCNVVGVVAAAENMPGSTATKPGDVVRALDGTTIEVINTDAEGRLVLADGLAKAREMGATHLVDVATLTGAAVIALGHVATAMMSNDAGLAADVEYSAEAAGDRVAVLPMHPEYDVCLESDVADVKNWGGTESGTISGAVFLRTFTHGLPWVHLDIAGTAWNNQRSQTQIPKGPSGTPVRTLIHLARRFAERRS